MINKFNVKMLLLFVVYTLIAIILIHVRLPWIDEGWFSFAAKSIMIYNKPFDLKAAMYQTDLKSAFDFFGYGVILSIGYSIFGISITVGRLLSVLGGILFLIFLSHLLKKIKIDNFNSILIVFLIAFNYFFLIVSTQIRPEIFSILFVLLGIIFFEKFRETSQPKYISYSHLMLIFSALFHLQASFAGLFLWIITLIEGRSSWFKTFNALIVPYLCVFALGVLYIGFSDIKSRIDDTLFSEGMLGHAGGMFQSVIDSLQTKRHFRLVVQLLLIFFFPLAIILNLRNSLHKNMRSILFISIGSYISWIFTTTQINDYHAIWLIFPFIFILTLVGKMEFKLIPIIKGFILLPIILLFVGLVFFARNIIHNPRASLYEEDINYFKSQFDINNSTIVGAAEFMFVNEFNPSNCLKSHREESPDFVVWQNIFKQNTYNFELSHYSLFYEGKVYNIYKKQENANLQ